MAALQKYEKGTVEPIVLGNGLFLDSEAVRGHTVEDFMKFMSNGNN